MDAITVKQVTKKYGKLIALNNLSLRVKRGSVHGLLGPNGAGKTTLFRAILGLISVDKGGQIEILGKPPRDVNMNVVGYLPENGHPYEYLTGRDFLYLVGNLHDVPIVKLNSQIDKYSEMFQLTELNAISGTYSKGTKQKLVMMAALLHDPEILVLDEPFVDIDVIARRKFQDFVKNYSSEGKTVFIATHILETAEGLCNEISIIKRGNLLYSGLLDKKDGLEKFFFETINV